MSYRELRRTLYVSAPAVVTFLLLYAVMLQLLGYGYTLYVVSALVFTVISIGFTILGQLRSRSDPGTPASGRSGEQGVPDTGESNRADCFRLGRGTRRGRLGPSLAGGCLPSRRQLLSSRENPIISKKKIQQS